jgi:hypothetical protein
MHRNAYDVTGTIPTSEPAAVGEEVVRIYRRLYPRASAALLERAFVHLAGLYDGAHPAYWPCDTAYHDLQHVLDVTLAMARLMDGYQHSRRPGEETLARELFVVGALAALFHDFGYLRKRNDRRHRYGAEYTLVHVSRGAAYLRGYARELGLGEAPARLAGTLVHFTGYERDAKSIRIGSGVARHLGQMLGSADILAQMSDRCYLEKCRDRLYPEFVLGARAAHPGARPLPVFASGKELIAKTPAFYEGAARRLERDLAGSHAYAARHFGGPNLYVESMRRNAAHAGRSRPPLRRQPPRTLRPEVEPYPRRLPGR